MPANKYVPQWFKQVKKDHGKSHSNVKLCPSFLKYFSAGWVMPLWCDVELWINDDGLVSWRTPNVVFNLNFTMIISTKIYYLNMSNPQLSVYSNQCLHG